MRILFLHEVGYLEKPIFEMHEFPEHLAARGHEIGFCDFSEMSGASQSARTETLVGGRVLDDVKIRLFSQKSVAQGIVGRLIAVFLFPRFFDKVLSDFNPEVVVSYAVPTSGWQALLMCKRAGIPFVFRALDVSHKIRRTSLSALVKAAERFVYKGSTWVSCNNPAMQSYCVTMGASPAKSSVELPPLDLAHFLLSGGDKQSFLRKLGLSKDSSIIVYMGSFFYFSGLDRVLERLSSLTSKPSLILVGGGDQESELKELVKNRNLEEHVRFTGFVAFEDLPGYLSIADVAINPMLPSLVAHAALPNKVLQYMAAGLPVVSTSLNGLSALFPAADGLTLVSSPEEVLEKSISIATRASRSQMGQANRKLVEKIFAREKTVDAFENLLESVRGF